MRKIKNKILRYLFFFLVALAALLLILWCTGAAWYTFPWNGILRQCGIIFYSGALCGLATAGFRRRRLWFGAGGIMLFTMIYFAWLTPSNRFSEVKWQIPWARMPRVEMLPGGMVCISEMRNFRYRTPDDFDVAYTGMNFDPAAVTAVDLAVSHWDGIEAVAHTMLSFEFDDGRHLAVSMETRLPEGAEQGFLPGFFKQYEIIMLLAPEEDLFKLRSNYRQEELYLYRTNATRGQCRELLEMVLRGAASLYETPRFYNSITTNCTTSLMPLLHRINPGLKRDVRLLANGYSDEFLYDLGYLAHREGETFAELKQRSLLKPAWSGNYSAEIRSQLP